MEHFAGRRSSTRTRDRRASCARAGRLLASGSERHSYPVCWRCKNPIIFRATEQWFIGLDTDGLRERTLEAIAQVRWYPAWGEERIRNMIATRPDWCISRQRLWGVPIPAFYCEGCGEALLDAGARRGAWPTSSRRRAPTPGTSARRRTCCRRASPARSAAAASSTRRRTSSTSGSTPARRTRPCSASRPDLPWPADVYLEGSDQHRGWFHSSLLIGVGTRGAAPYRSVVTHGFTVDAQRPEDLEEPRQRRRHRRS